MPDLRTHDARVARVLMTPLESVGLSLILAVIVLYLAKPRL